jgi:catechol 2,3-dioxygenase-like lactoylglutathione lyase family enzyme
MTGSLSSVGAITLFVDDVQRSKSWYQNVFDRPLVFEDAQSAVFKFDNLIVNLLRITAAHELIAPASVAPRQAGSYAQITIWVDDADAVCADLQRRGVVLLNGPMNRVWGQRTACFADPDGHLWEVAQHIS